jgi:hydroxymethylpyrimidine pyrophosphatase-like HAD family hydrolase
MIMALNLRKMRKNSKGFIGCDLDGTLAYYDEWKGIEHIGKPIPKMLERVKKWLEDGKEVRIITARAAEGPEAIKYVEEWLEENDIGGLVITCEKTMAMIELWDDRAVQVKRNTGERVDGET